MNIVPNWHSIEEENKNPEEDKDIPADSHHRQPRWNKMPHRQHHEGGYEENLVGQGIKIGAQPALLVKHAGDKSISPVTYPGNDKNNERGRKIFSNEIDDKNGSKDDPQARD